MLDQVPMDVQLCCSIAVLHSMPIAVLHSKSNLIRAFATSVYVVV